MNKAYTDLFHSTLLGFYSLKFNLAVHVLIEEVREEMESVEQRIVKLRNPNHGSMFKASHQSSSAVDE